MLLEYEFAGIKGIINIELDIIRDNIKQFGIYHDWENYVYCK